MDETSARRFELERVIGRGSYGAVYRARLVGDDGFTKPVALKILHADAVEADVEGRLRDEARLLGLVRHRAIPRVDAIVRVRGRCAVVMELADGVHLRKVLQQGAIPLGAALEIAAEVANALHVAATQEGPDGRPLGLVHRDIKPSNLQITAAGEVKLLDFGIARATFPARESRTSGEVLGSLGYMSPERLDGVDGPEGDVYALGVVLWEMLVGRRLGRTWTQARRHDAFLATALADLSQALGRDGAKVVGLVGGMLAYDADARPTAKDVERRCRALRNGLQAEWLTDWAERTVPPLQEPGDVDELCGNGLSEGQEATAHRPLTLKAAGLLGAFAGAMLAAAALGAVAGIAFHEAAEAAEAPAASKPAPGPAPAPAPGAERAHAGVRLTAPDQAALAD